MQRKFIVFIITFLVIVLCSILQLTSIWSSLEWKAFDFRMRLFGTAKPNHDIAIIEIDENTLNSLKWPLSRDYYATLLGILDEYGARAIAFDLVFSDPSENSQADTILASASGEFSNVYHSFYFAKKNQSQGGMKELEKFSYEIQDINKNYVSCNNPVLPYSYLFEQLNHLGHINLVSDDDGVYRRIPLVIEFGKYFYPALSLKLIIGSFNIKKPHIKNGHYIRLTNEQLDIRIPTDFETRMLINFTYGFNRYSFIDVLHDYKNISEGKNAKAGKNNFKDKYVIIGNTVATLGDYAASPINSHYPKLLIHANALNTILNKNFITKANPYINLLILIILSALIAVFCANFGVLKAAVFTGSLLFFTWIINIVCFRNNILINITITSCGAILSFIANSIYFNLVREEEKFKLEKAIGKYVSPSILDKIKSGHKRLYGSMGKQVLTILFSDVKGFSTLCDTMDHEIIYAQVIEYLEHMSRIIIANGGTVDKFMGDGIMAYFGADRKPEHAILAVQAAWEMQEKVAELRKKWINEAKAMFQVRIGINTGPVTVGDLGSNDFSDYTVFGNNVNLAQRLESNANPEHILVSQSCYGASKEYFDYKHLGSKKAKGIVEMVETYEVVAPKKVFDISNFINRRQDERRKGERRSGKDRRKV